MAAREKPLVDDEKLRAGLRRLEELGTEIQPEAENVLPPLSATRPAACAPVSDEERVRLRHILKMHGLELINDGAVYRIKNQTAFEIYTLKTSPLVDEARGGGEGYALIEGVCRFCGAKK